MPMNMVLENIQYILAGTLNILILTVFFLNKKPIVSNIHFIETSFIHWSYKRRTTPQKTYKQYLRTLNQMVSLTILAALNIIFGPLVTAIIDLDTMPLDDSSHFIMFWPKVSCVYYL